MKSNVWFEKTLVVRQPLLQVEEVERALQGVLTLRDLWVQRNWLSEAEAPPFFTLGSAAYLDVPERSKPLKELESDMWEYQQKWQLLNPALWNEFSWLYEKIGAAIKFSCPILLLLI